MTKVIHLQPFPATITESEELKDGTTVEQATDRFWRIVLAMAVRDGVTSAHYHPWRADPSGEDTLSYILDNIRYAIPSPDPAPEFVGQLLDAARRLVVTGPVGRLRAWIAGVAIGRIRLVAGSDESEWCVVSWGRGSHAGVELLRLTPLPVVVPWSDLRPSS